MVAISSVFDSGSIEVVDASDPSDIRLKLVPEPHSELECALPTAPRVAQQLPASGCGCLPLTALPAASACP